MDFIRKYASCPSFLLQTEDKFSFEATQTKEC